MRHSPGSSAASRLALGAALTGCLVATASLPALRAQTPPPVPPPKPRVYGATPPPVAPSRVEKLDGSRVRIGTVVVDLAAKEVVVPGVVNDVPVLEFLVNTKGGYKSYESAIEIDSNAIDFNLGLILIGFDRDRATNRPRFHFDPIPPSGDQVDLWIAWNANGAERRVRAEELIWDEGAKATLPVGRWVYTGSRFLQNSRAFLADMDGVVIGFVHTPAPLIERAEPVPGPYGAIRINPNLELKPGTAVRVIARAVPTPTQ
ncbi:MAG: YdjY domain-containing protein [Vicinamibacterales bacterium]